MHLIIGGAYQGKEDYAVRELGVDSGEICRCDLEREPDFSASCIAGLEQFARRCIRTGREPAAVLEGLELRGKVLICEDISCGLVPLEAEARAWREATGRMLCALADRADQVTRIFCGLPQRLKG